jgi:hypothetical protein
VSLRQAVSKLPGEVGTSCRAETTPSSQEFADQCALGMGQTGERRARGAKVRRARFLDDHRTGGIVADALSLATQEDRDHPHDIEAGQKIDGPQQVPDESPSPIERSATVADYAQAAYALARRLTAPKSLERSKVKEVDAEHDGIENRYRHPRNREGPVRILVEGAPRGLKVDHHNHERGQHGNGLPGEVDQVSQKAAANPREGQHDFDVFRRLDDRDVVHRAHACKRYHDPHTLESMEYEIRARSIGEIMDGALQIYRDNLRPFLTLSVLIYGPVYVIQNVLLYFAGAAEGSARAARAAINVGVVTIPVFVLAYAIGPVVFTVAIVAAFRGESVTAGSVLQRALPLFWTAIYSNTLLILGSCLGFILFVIPGLIFWFNRLINIQVIVIEGKGGAAALSRSKELVKGDGGRVQWPWFLTGLLTGAISLGFTQVIPASLPWGLRQALAAVPYLVLAPLTPAVLTLCYFDYRVRKEAFDLKVLADETLGALHPASEQPAR